ncbi:hypothetical protein L3Q67_37410 [Saccharothrix sp. AJ9571]|nr:hypothetical protein L3Q67_37410 [Saccharothrix sp. AJ9571]
MTTVVVNCEVASFIGLRRVGPPSGTACLSPVNDLKATSPPCRMRGRKNE